MALIVGVDRGFITREQGLERLARIVDFLEKAPRYHGVWSHFMDGSTGQTLPVFDMFDNGGDLVETAFLMEGLLAARQYFQGASARERDLFAGIFPLWDTVGGTGTGARRKATPFTGTGRPSGRGTSIIV